MDVQNRIRNMFDRDCTSSRKYNLTLLSYLPYSNSFTSLWHNTDRTINTYNPESKYNTVHPDILTNVSDRSHTHTWRPSSMLFAQHVSSIKHAIRTTTRSMSHQHPRSTSRRRASRLCAYVWYRGELNEPAIDTAWFIAWRGTYSGSEKIDHGPLVSSKCTGVITVSRGKGSFFCSCCNVVWKCCSELGNWRKAHRYGSCDLWMGGYAVLFGCSEYFCINIFLVIVVYLWITEVVICDWEDIT